MEKKESYYVGIKDPRELRRALLEASKSLVLSMQVNQKIKGIRKEKETLKNKLKSDVKELKMLLLKLEKMLPEHVFENKQAQEKPLPKITPPKPVQKDETQKDIDKIHNQIELIEKKLKSLDEEPRRKHR